MRNLILIFVFLSTVISCKKDCINNIENSGLYFKNYKNNYYCAFVERPFEYVFHNYDDFLDNSNLITGCYWSDIVVVPLDFNGVILCYGVDTKIYNNQQTISVIKNDCDKKILYNLKINELDNTSIVMDGQNYYESVVTVIDSIPSDYTVEFSHEIIPYKE